MYKYLLGLALPLMLFSCAENDLGSMDGTRLSEGRAQVTIEVGAPGAFSASALSRSISQDNEDTLDGRFVVFAFDGDSDESNLLFIVRTGDTNENSNLNATSTVYGDYTGSPSIAWHPADELSEKGRLYIEDDENDQAMELLILANVDPTTELNLTSTTPTRADVIDALSAFDYDVTDENLESIPMAGEFELENGITLGSTGAIQLRRSVAKVTVRVEYDENNLDQYFLPSCVYMLNMNRTTATVYSPSSVEPNFPEGEVVFNQYDPSDVTPVYFPNEWTEGVDDDGDPVMYKEVVFYVAENENLKGDAFVDMGNPTEFNTTDPRISILVEGEFDDYDGETMSECWYRLDLLPATAMSGDDELDYILRNHHYRFVIHDMQTRGSTADRAALALSVPDNYPFSESSGSYVVVEDDDIVSITVERYNSSGGDEPYYVGVSSTSVDVPRTQDACFRVVIVTNCPDWTIDPSDIPKHDADNSAFDFVYETFLGKQTMWVWLDYPAIVRENESYAYYIVAGRIRKKMRINVVEGEYTGPDEDPYEEPADEEP